MEYVQILMSISTEETFELGCLTFELVETSNSDPPLLLHTNVCHLRIHQHQFSEKWQLNFYVVACSSCQNSTAGDITD